MRALLALLLLSCLALAGCSGDADPQDGDDTGDDAAPGPMGNMTAPMDAAPMTHTVMMQNNAFEPAAMTIHAGDTVRWHTMDVQRHNVVSESAGNEYRSGDVSSLNVPNTLPDSTEHTFTAVGHVDYVCEYHQGMVATLEVVPANQTLPEGGM